jgi:3-oxoacyl-[acyl-carrier-protein] synthase III
MENNRMFPPGRSFGGPKRCTETGIRFSGTKRWERYSQPGRDSGEKVMTDDPRKRGEADRSKISMSEDHEVQYWTKHLGVTREQLQKAVDKVGNSAAAVRKELMKP